MKHRSHHSSHHAGHGMARHGSHHTGSGGSSIGGGKSASKSGFILGLIGGGVGLLVGLWAPFSLFLPNWVNFSVLSFIGLVVGGLLLATSLYLLKILPGFMKAMSFLVFFGFLQLMQGIMVFLTMFDDFGLVENISPYFEYNLFILMPIFFALGFIPMIFSLFYSQYVNLFIRDNIINNPNEGYRVSGRIISLKDTAVRVNKRRMYSVELDLTVPNFGNYKKTISTSISLLEVDKYKVGNSVDVVVSKKNKDHVFIL